MRAAPKEQPPRNLSGKRTDAPSDSEEWLAHSSANPPQEQAAATADVNLSGPKQKGRCGHTVWPQPHP